MADGHPGKHEERPAGAPIASDPARHVALVQGIFYVATGVWPLVSLRTFEAVTGPKTDKWLVKTVGALIGVVGAALLAEARRPTVSPAGKLVGAGSALALAAVDVVYTSRGRISKVYLLDAAVELGIAGAWLLSTARRPGGLPS
ncbi:hypothetical protein SOCE26_103050 [Sorangium cellulosum]|uniref:DUF4345 domain-containing protein n=1 Tax=Sorangium cellulosum TaxID=56 RepID=A0A2L0FB26_SORCE|nr:hypothetical protein [Sorangium cellulosum]AUX48764.1 hypothetical protein SOCE26_103050 [Sorangium cellulosum]